MTIKPMEILFDNTQDPVVPSDTIRERIITRFDDATVDVYDLTGSGNHYQVEVTTQAFEGKTPIERHRMVNDTLKDLLADGQLHALALTCRVPAAS
jgi:stress-induced morphogen